MPRKSRGDATQFGRYDLRGLRPVFGASGQATLYQTFQRNRYPWTAGACRRAIGVQNRCESTSISLTMEGPDTGDHLEND
jgi:hypothetical protein